MGGPTTGVLLPYKLNGMQLESLQAILEGISNDFVKSDIWDWEFWINNTKSIGGVYVDAGVGRYFAIAARLPQMEAHVQDSIVTAFGFKPQQILQLDAMCNNKEDHSVMGVLALYLSKRYGGIVDFGGGLLPPLPQEMYQRMWIWEQASWCDVSAYFEEMVKGMPGKVIGVESEIPGGRTWACHFSDAEFMKAWLQHPNFHMIK